MKVKKIYLINKWSKQNNRDYWLGQLIKVYDSNPKFAGKTEILSGVVVSDGTAAVFSEKSCVDVSNFIQDAESITQEEKDCLRMNYPDINIKFEE